MATNLAVEDRLITLAQKVGGHKTKRAAVTEALEEYIRYHRQLKVVDLFGRISYDPHFDYKRQRKRT
jgi:hypothetical protein